MTIRAPLGIRDSGRSVKLARPAPWVRASRGGMILLQGSVTVVGKALDDHANATWVQIVPASTYGAISLIEINPQSTVVGSMLSVGVGAAGAEQVILDRLPVHGWNSQSGGGPQIPIPVRVPAGVRVAIKMSVSQATNFTCYPGFAIHSSDINQQLPASLEVIGRGSAGAGPSGTPLVSGTTAFGTELISSTATDYQTVILIQNATTTGGAYNGNAALTLGVGASGAEVARFSLHGNVNNNSFYSYTAAFPGSGPIPAGSRIAVRHNLSNVTACGVTAIGVPYA